MSPFVLNLTGPESVSIRSVAQRLADLLGRELRFTETEAKTALLSNAAKCHGMFGYPSVPLDELITLTADWMLAGGELLGKPTKFQQRDGRF